MAGEMVAVLYRGARRGASPAAPAPGYSNTKELGRVLYTDYVFPFEIAAVILLVAFVAAIAITLKSRKKTKSQDARTQLSAHPAGRVRIVKMMDEASGTRAAPLCPA